MKTENIHKYIALMDQIKKRTNVVDQIMQGKTHSVYKATTTETLYLQYRKIIELIAMGSLVANKDEFSKTHKKFGKYWNAEKIIKDIENINPNFYPVPISQVTSNDPTIKSRFEKIPEANYLGKKDFIKLYKLCGVILHSENPYGRKINFEEYAKTAKSWQYKIRNLLNAHQIRLINDSNLYIIQMGAPDKSPTYTSFQMIKSK